MVVRDNSDSRVLNIVFDRRTGWNSGHVAGDGTRDVRTGVVGTTRFIINFFIIVRLDSTLFRGILYAA